MSLINSIDTERTGERTSKHHMFNLGATIKSVQTGNEIAFKEIVLNMPSDRSWDKETKNWVRKHPALLEIVSVSD
jgi:hypothetical protein